MHFGQRTGFSTLGCHSCSHRTQVSVMSNPRESCYYTTMSALELHHLLLLLP